MHNKSVSQSINQSNLSLVCRQGDVVDGHGDSFSVVCLNGVVNFVVSLGDVNDYPRGTVLVVAGRSVNRQSNFQRFRYRNNEVRDKLFRFAVIEVHLKTEYLLKTSIVRTYNLKITYVLIL